MTPTCIQPAAQTAIDNFLSAKGRVERALATTAPDRVAWSPSPTSRTPAEIVAHLAFTLTGFTHMLNQPPITMAQFEAGVEGLRAQEGEIKTAEKALDLLETHGKSYVTWLENLTPEQLASMVKAPFGEIPLTVAIEILPGHMSGHASQIEYIQTVYGDRSWHVG